jgi:hypothetical protein
LFPGPDQIADPQATLEHQSSDWKQQCHESFIQPHITSFDYPRHLRNPRELRKQAGFG